MKSELIRFVLKSPSPKRYNGPNSELKNSEPVLAEIIIRHSPNFTGYIIEELHTYPYEC